MGRTPLRGGELLNSLGNCTPYVQGLGKGTRATGSFTQQHVHLSSKPISERTWCSRREHNKDRNLGLD